MTNSLLSQQTHSPQDEVYDEDGHEVLCNIPDYCVVMFLV
jgi:hypothetical protein